MHITFTSATFNYHYSKQTTDNSALIADDLIQACGRQVTKLAGAVKHNTCVNGACELNWKPSKAV